MSYIFTGKLIYDEGVEEVTEKFSKREFVLESLDGGDYPQLIKFQLIQDRCSLLDPYKIGDKIQVDFDLKGREWNGRYFTNLQAWRITNPEIKRKPANASTIAPEVDDVDDEPIGADDDMPF